MIPASIPPDEPLTDEPESVDVARLRPIAPHEADWWRIVVAHGPNHPALMGTADIAAALEVKPQTVRKWRMQGDGFPLPVIVGGRLRHLRRELKVWAASNGYDPTRLEILSLSRWR